MADKLRIACPNCQHDLKLPVNLVGQAVSCKYCSHTFKARDYVRLACPACQANLEVRREYLGRGVNCRECRHPFVAQTPDDARHSSSANLSNQSSALSHQPPIGAAPRLASGADTKPLVSTELERAQKALKIALAKKLKYKSKAREADAARERTLQELSEIRATLETQLRDAANQIQADKEAHRAALMALRAELGAKLDEARQARSAEEAAHHASMEAAQAATAQWREQCEAERVAHTSRVDACEDEIARLQVALSTLNEVHGKTTSELGQLAERAAEAAACLESERAAWVAEKNHLLARIDAAESAAREEAVRSKERSDASLAVAQSEYDLATRALQERINELAGQLAARQQEAAESAETAARLTLEVEVLRASVLEINTNHAQERASARYEIDELRRALERALELERQSSTNKEQHARRIAELEHQLRAEPPATAPPAARPAELAARDGQLESLQRRLSVALAHNEALRQHLRTLGIKIS